MSMFVGKRHWTKPSRQDMNTWLTNKNFMPYKQWIIASCSVLIFNSV